MDSAKEGPGRDLPEVHTRVADRVASDPSRLVSILDSYYQAEMRRVLAWRDRLDRTTNWAVVLTATLLTWTFSSEDNPHYVVLIGVAAVSFFLFIEARRYRMYDVWRSRLRLMEENFFATALDGKEVEEGDWRERISRDLRFPRMKIPWKEAVQRRLRRVYLPIFLLLAAAWGVRVTAFAPDHQGPREAASIGRIAGVWTWSAVLALYGALLILSLWPIPRRARGEVHDSSDEF